MEMSRLAEITKALNRLSPAAGYIPGSLIERFEAVVHLEIGD
jgi:hypothetical protein